MSESTASDDRYDNWMQMLQATAARFEEENDDLEALLEGDIGFHAYFAVGETLLAVFRLQSSRASMRRSKRSPSTPTSSKYDTER
ncbi:hypothetical protein FK85_24845 [Halorubrum saccharovorum]|uniref:Uncharacterized protein n=1 Tax=Halorubrum saccharovorum TaxID=2248 RepID=A0A0F8D6H6_9EURY|nr:hypothetical protein [Halorubrum saccharovorum]KKF39899.1 hypothetical protein FK85_24845 [Halorubrum saccharovorum]